MILLKNKIYIYGIVQGVGFRPFVARLAKEHNIRGAVRNALGHVAIEAVGTAEDMFRFVCDLEKRKPEGSVINSIRQKSEPLAGNAYVCHDFTIEPSGGDGEGPVMPAPDIAVCDDCVKELFAPGDPRRENPFISCTRCGPRFSIMRCAPYDRENTSMGVFRLCSLCESQYKDPADRRFHA
ncbi:MAG: acylphosphatase, partial [Oscillospiraceae bacterium]|nr:acylphosphatase [Oscillospiraceae bacterium]